MTSAGAVYKLFLVVHPLILKGRRKIDLLAGPLAERVKRQSLSSFFRNFRRSTPIGQTAVQEPQSTHRPTMWYIRINWKSWVSEGLAPMSTQRGWDWSAKQIRQ